MGVDRLDVFTARMTHQSFADFLHDPGLHQAGVERVAQVMEAEVANLGPAQRGLPRSLDLVDRVAPEGEGQAFVLPVLSEKLKESPSEWNLTSFPAGRL